MGKLYWTISIIVSIIFLICIPPIGIIIAITILLIIPRIGIKPHKDNNINKQIELLASQLGIEYGTPEEKLEQIAVLAAKGKDRE